MEALRLKTTSGRLSGAANGSDEIIATTMSADERIAKTVARNDSAAIRVVISDRARR
jgi:hypothetical protein